MGSNTMIYHITTKKEWENAQSLGEYTSPSLETEGFIHCSTLQQTVDTANLFFKGQSGLVLLCIDEKALKSACRYEKPASVGGIEHEPGVGSLFPHIYGPINNQAVIKVVDFLPDADGLFELPEELVH